MGERCECHVCGSHVGLDGLCKQCFWRRSYENANREWEARRPYIAALEAVASKARVVSAHWGSRYLRELDEALAALDALRKKESKP